jgi:hypothetical protein
MSEHWTPKVGETIKYVSKSIMSGAFANVQAMNVTKVTAAGYVYIDRRRDKKYGRADVAATRFYEAGKQPGSMYHTWIERASTEEAATLPRSDAEGARYARSLKETA